MPVKRFLFSAFVVFSLCACLTGCNKQAKTRSAPVSRSATVDYIANKNSKKFHYPYCEAVGKMKESNKLYFNGSRNDLINSGYVPCKICNP